MCIRFLFHFSFLLTLFNWSLAQTNVVLEGELNVDLSLTQINIRQSENISVEMQVLNTNYDQNGLILSTVQLSKYESSSGDGDIIPNIFFISAFFSNQIINTTNFTFIHSQIESEALSSLFSLGQVSLVFFIQTTNTTFGGDPANVFLSGKTQIDFLNGEFFDEIAKNNEPRVNQNFLSSQRPTLNILFPKEKPNRINVVNTKGKTILTPTLTSGPVNFFQYEISIESFPGSGRYLLYYEFNDKKYRKWILVKK